MTLYISDLDGTLLRNDATLSPETVDMLNTLLDRGLCFTYATARSLSSAGEITKALRLKLPVITYNGVVMGDGKAATYAFLDKAALAGLFFALEKHRIPLLVYSVIDGQEKCSWIQGIQTDGIARYLLERQGNRRMRPVNSYEALFAGDIYYFALIGDENEVAPAKALFEKEARLHVHLQRDTYHKEDFWLEVFRSDANKAAAAARLKAQLGADKLICFGDNLNDMPLFAVADECYAVANGREELKKIATAVIAENEADGVARWLLENC